jgi:hypothetical protein
LRFCISIAFTPLFNHVSKNPGDGDADTA